MSAVPEDEFQLPVSLAQARLLVLEAMQPNTAQYNLCIAFTVSGAFDADTFEACLALVAARHEALRTTFRTVGGVPVQTIAAEPRVDHRRLAAADPGEAADLVAAEAERPFDLAAGPLFRGSLVAVADGTHRIIIGMHHLVADGWSLSIVLGELSRAYAAFIVGAEPDLGRPPRLHYADYAQWQRDRHIAGEFDESVRYWVNQLRGAPPYLELPTDFPRPAVRTPDGAWRRAVLSDRVVALLDAASRRARTTRFQTLLAAFAVFLSRMSGQDDVVIGIPVADRDGLDRQDLVGMLVGTLAVRCDVSGQPTFDEVLRRVARHAAERLARQDAPFEAVVEALAPPRDPARDPVLQVMFSYDDRASYPLDLPGTHAEQVEFVSRVTDVDFSLRVERHGTHLILWFGYRTQLYAATTIAGWLDDFQTLLAGLLTEEGARPVAEVPLLAPARRKAILRASSGPLPARSRPCTAETAHGLVDALARSAPERIAVADRSGTMPYGVLADRSDDFARMLVDSGVRRGEVIAVSMARTAQIAVAVLGVMKAGAAYLPLDPAHPAARRAAMVQDAGVRVVVTESDLERSVPAASAPLPALMGRDLAYVLYTSGSTGRPKGVAVEHRSLLWQITAMRRQVTVVPDDRLLQTASFSVDVSISDMFRCWSAGAALYIADEDERFGGPLAARIAASTITAVDLLPAVLASIPVPVERFPLLRTVLVGAEAPGADLARRWLVGGRRLLNAYGPTEATITASVGALWPDKPPRIGRPLEGSGIYVLDARLEPVPPGVVGEMYITGPGVARSYLGRPGPTAERFLPDPHSPVPGQRMYRTGDLGRYTVAGDLDIVGRIDDQMKVRGFRIEPGEIEAALLGHPGVANAAVVARRDPAGADARLIAYVVGTTDVAPPSDRELRIWLASRLPAHMVPAVFVPLDRLPVTPAGKTDRPALPAPPETRPDLGHAYTAPVTQTERRIAAVWAQTLCLDRVGADDNFFDLGGNSLRLLATQAALGASGTRATLIDMFRFPTVRALAGFLDGGARPGAGEVTAAAAARRGADRRDRLNAFGPAGKLLRKETEIE